MCVSYFDQKIISDPLLLKRHKHRVIGKSMVRCTGSGDSAREGGGGVQVQG